MQDNLSNTLAAWLGYSVLWGCAAAVIVPKALRWAAGALEDGAIALMVLSTRLASLWGRAERKPSTEDRYYPMTTGRGNKP